MSSLLESYEAIPLSDQDKSVILSLKVKYNEPFVRRTDEYN
jgi:hypothetical protein